MLQHTYFSLYSWAIVAFVFHLLTFQLKKLTQHQFTSIFGKRLDGLEGMAFKLTTSAAGEANGSFIKMHFKGKEPVHEKFTTINPYTRKPLVFLLDAYFE